MKADPALLERAVANLVENAVAHSPSGAPGPRRGRGRSPAACSSGSIDRGPGIAPAERERVFQPFQRMDDSPSHGAGVGLGLAVARGFTRAMGGDLTIDDTPGGGTTMILELEVAA